MKLGTIMPILSEKAMAPHSSTLSWKISWMEEPGGLHSMGSWRVGYDWASSLSLFTFMHWRRKWQPTPVFLPGESWDGGAWWAAVSGVAQSRTWLKWRSSSLAACPFYRWHKRWGNQFKIISSISGKPYLFCSECLVYGDFHFLLNSAF